MSSATGQDGAPQARSRRRGAVVAVAGVAVVAVLVVLGFVVGGGRDDEGTPTVADSTSTAPAPDPAESAPGTDPGGPAGAPAATPAPSTSAPDAAPVVADTLPEALPPVAFDLPVDVAGITASVARIESIDGQATGPGDVAGPAVRVTVRIDNPTQEATSVDGVSVNVFHGPDLTPATPLGDPSQDPFAGEVPAGGSATGVYVFSVPAAAQGDVTVQVGHRAGAPLAVFSGAVR